MHKLTDGIKNFHRFLSHHHFYPIVLSTILVFLFFVGRIYWSQQVIYQNLIWNLFLAWLPYLFCLGVAAIHQARPSWWWAMIVPAVLWVVFLPNALYIVTDLIHLKTQEVIPLWYDAGLLSITAWTGLFLAVVSLYTMQKIVHSYTGKLAGWGFSLLIIGSSGYGVYLGRFLRWNSWDLLNEPLEIISDSLSPLANPLQYKDKIVFIMMYTALYLVTYLAFSWLRPMDSILEVEKNQS
jgi:uncharacterized membrane protein